MQSCKIDADVWDIKRITGVWLRHLHSHTVPRSPLPALLQPFRQQEGFSWIIPHLSSSAKFLGTGTGTAFGTSPLLALHTFGQNSTWAMLSFILLLICKAKEISPLSTCAGSKLSGRSSFDGIFFVPVGARIVFLKKYKAFPESDWFAHHTQRRALALTGFTKLLRFTPENCNAQPLSLKGYKQELMTQRHSSIEQTDFQSRKRVLQNIVTGQTVRRRAVSGPLAFHSTSPRLARL